MQRRHTHTQYVQFMKIRCKIVLFIFFVKIVNDERWINYILNLFLSFLELKQKYTNC